MSFTKTHFIKKKKKKQKNVKPPRFLRQRRDVSSADVILMTEPLLLNTTPIGPIKVVLCFWDLQANIYVLSLDPLWE